MGAYDKRWRDAKNFLKEDFGRIKNVPAEEIKYMGDGELIFFQYYCGMGMCDVDNTIGFLENGKINYYCTEVYDFKTNKEVGPGFLALKSFNGLEDFDSKKIYEIRYQNELSGKDDLVNDYKLKNFEFVELSFGNYVLVHKKYFDGYYNFIKQLVKKYNMLESFFWINIDVVSKIYHSGNKEKFLSLSN